ncbi:ABC transporter substrate-binding protein [Phyllobacterium sp. 21LDTY02-6]|uniref:ABC transporter substrate-binding protein n=1 Tax=unclassified Phyllobacterium TaxID=2638441 RepID=UPI002020069B|nr:MULTISPECIES: ABC transporter substrate-binding protein [unclassified Phyllobacterium]MCO4318706.1 ABC transporter substrate-binding protein [Phyllobacterium sp. 21LDTY02-6]MCX8281222.1 ABC transporter substrate-binding protein [Phyllobacterium sp. 0TCS1.6C]MCX8294492.1 ABC transporter substrate-binding protein [Phyllobacterium sp. 0TCS1.6A]
MMNRILPVVLAVALSATAALADSGSTTFFKALGPEEGRLTIHSSTDLAAMKSLIADFQTIWPDTSIEYKEYLTNELNALAAEACRKQEPLGDLLLSSSVDQLVKLANDGCARPHNSPETARVAEWANWRDEVFGFTYEPAVFVYNAERVPPRDVPRTHLELADLLREQLDTYRGKVGTYDIRLSGIGYLLAFNDARQTSAVFGRLLESMARAATVARCCTGEILEEVAKGNLYIGYNMLGSYAYDAALRHPQLRVVVPRDYTLVLSRGALIPKNAVAAELGARFLDYLLSDRGQELARSNGFYFSEDGALPAEVDGPQNLKASGVAQPIRIGPALLAVQDRAQRQGFIDDWSKSLIELNSPGWTRE